MNKNRALVRWSQTQTGYLSPNSIICSPRGLDVPRILLRQRSKVCSAYMKSLVFESKLDKEIMTNVARLERHAPIQYAAIQLVFLLSFSEEPLW